MDKEKTMYATAQSSSYHLPVEPAPRSLLIVEDDKAFLERLSRAMESRGWWNVRRCVRDSHKPSAIIQRRKVSRPTRSSCLSRSTSVASVGPKSAYLVLTSSTAYFRIPSFRLRFDVRPDYGPGDSDV